MYNPARAKFQTNQTINPTTGNTVYAKDGIMICMLRPDIAQFLNTKWGFINAVSDYVGHSIPARVTSNYQENNWGKIINGHPLLDKAMSLMTV